MRKLRNEELNRLTTAEFKAVTKTPLIIILDNVRSLHNIGSVFRTSDAFRIEKIYLCGITATPPHKDIQKTALGATEAVEWEHRADIINLVLELKNEGVIIWSVEQTENSTMLNEIKLDINKKYALIFGNEVEGVQQSVVSISDDIVEIPQLGTKHSLNIAVSAGIAIWEMTKPFMNQ